jgi:hypothetical protein
MPLVGPQKLVNQVTKQKGGQSRVTSNTWLRKTAEQGNKRGMERREEGGQNGCN